MSTSRPVRSALLLSMLALAPSCSAPGGAAYLLYSSSPTPSANPISSTNPAPSTAPNGGIVIVVPTPAPVLCVPASVTIGIGQRTVISCTAAGYEGPFSWAVDNPNVAAVQLAAGTFTLFYIAGLHAGTAVLSLWYQTSAIGQAVITVPTR